MAYQQAEQDRPVFTHQLRSPASPVDPAHSAQRYFTGADGERWVCDVVRVMRFSHDDSAHVEVRTSYDKSRAEITAYLTAAELRDFACRLLDAAHDLEAFPAASVAVPA